jgi:hypothetical protein
VHRRRRERVRGGVPQARERLSLPSQPAHAHIVMPCRPRDEILDRSRVFHFDAMVVSSAQDSISIRLRRVNDITFDCKGNWFQLAENPC